MMAPNDYLSALQSISVDGLGEDWIRVSAAAKVAGIAYTDWHDWTQVSERYKGENDARSRWDSFKLDGGVGAGTLIHIAKEHGWKPTKGRKSHVRQPRAPIPLPTPQPLEFSPETHQRGNNFLLVQSGPSAADIWERCIPATWAHQYVKAKGLHGAVDGLRVVPDNDPLRIQRESMAGALVVPVYRVDGSISSLQFIAVGDTAKRLNDAGKSTKLNLPKHKIEGWFTVSQIADSAPIYVCEGIGQAVACWRATGLPSVVTFGIARTRSVVAALLQKHPNAALVLVPDSGQEEATDKVAIGHGLAVAKMPNGSAPNFDANDFAQREGDDVLADLLAGATVPSKPCPVDDDVDVDDFVGTGGAPFASDIDLSNRFTELCTGKYRWTHGLEWRVNTSTHWVQDNNLSRYNAAKEICQGVAADIEDGEEGLVKKICSAATINAVLMLARCDAGIVTGIEEWDAHTMLLNTPSGIYDLTTGAIIPRADNLLFTQITNIAPAAIPTPVWDKFTADVFGDAETIEFIQRMGGYCLTGSTREQKLFFLHGEGSNGKSVFLEVLRAIGGQYSHNLPSEALMTAKHERHPTTLAALHGKRLAISSEIEQTAHWAESRIKSLTGDATMTARYMRCDEFTFTITHKHVLAGNSKPRLKGDDFAMVRRMVLIPFTRTFKGEDCDDRLPQKLEAEYAGILNWFIQGARKWSESGLLIPSTIKESTAEYMAQQNDIQLWIEECCTVGGGLSVGSTVAYQSYAAFKSRNGEHPESAKAFSPRLEKLFPKVKVHGTMAFRGLALDPSAQQSNDYERGSRGF